MKKRSMEEGRQAGYEEGRIQAMAELEAAKKELDMQTKAMEQEYQKLIDELEPKFIHTLTGIYEEIFNVELKNYKSILHFYVDELGMNFHSAFLIKEMSNE